MKDLSGQRFGRLVVVRPIDKRGPDGGVVYECKCDCGNICYVWNNKLTRKTHSAKRSCGCFQQEKHTTTIHGGSKTPLFKKWMGMKYRCYDVNANHYQDYGGRRIRICDEWKNDFSAFQSWAISSGYKDGLSIDRIDVNGNYEPNNCRWVSLKQQQKNKRNVKLFTYKGETHNIAEWAELLGIKYGTLWKRLKKGMSFEDAISVTGVDYQNK